MHNLFTKITMPTKRSGNNGTRKNSTPIVKPKLPKPIEPEIAVEDPPDPSNNPQTQPETSSMDDENFCFVTDEEPVEQGTPLAAAEELLYHGLQELQRVYDAACETKAGKITIDKASFKKIGITFQQTWKQIKTTQRALEESIFVDTLKHIQASIIGLEQKYEDIQVKVTEAPKTYAEIVSSTTLSKDPKIELRTQRRKQREMLSQERAKYTVTLSTKDMKTSTQQSITKMSGKEIAERCQQAISSSKINGAQPTILGINKLANSIRIQFETEEQAKTVSDPKIDWDKAFQGLKLHKPNYGIVIHGVPRNDLDITTMTNTEVIKRLEMENNMQAGTITKITPLRRRDNQDSNKIKLHHSIVLHLNDKHTANKCITNGCYIDYIHHPAERFTPQFQVTQCFNCCDYGHRATYCKRQSRCGKCGDKHNTRECKSTIIECVQCKGQHEAWHSKCPARIAEANRLEEQMGRSSCLFH
jgi:hypothetical protein